MKALRCRCGCAVFFDNHECGHCGRQLAFDPVGLEMRAEVEPGAGLPVCENRNGDPRCNWLAPEGGTCLSCQASRVIPALSKTINRARWRKLEHAKRRLVYGLLRLGLPVDPQHLQFVFKEDRRTNPDVSDDHVAIGHRDGVITINAAEADAVYREEMRQAMNEPYRTLLGHFRHESGHYYYDLVVDEALRAPARSLFGDERQDYDSSLQRHYEQGPPDDWSERFISEYASAHPMEDWAECWAHVLHIHDALETAENLGLAPPAPPGAWRHAFLELAIGLNEVMRGLGLPDAYPFVINPVVGEKLDFVNDAIMRFTTPPPVP